MARLTARAWCFASRLNCRKTPLALRRSRSFRLHPRKHGKNVRRFAGASRTRRVWKSRRTNKRLRPPRKKTSISRRRTMGAKRVNVAALPQHCRPGRATDKKAPRSERSPPAAMSHSSGPSLMGRGAAAFAAALALSTPALAQAQQPRRDPPPSQPMTGLYQAAAPRFSVSRAIRKSTCCARPWRRTAARFTGPKTATSCFG
jgi:hypothetical protein